MVAVPRVRPLNPRRELLALHRKLFREQQALIDLAVAAYPPDFGAYEAAYKRGVRRFERVASYGEVLEAIDAADVVYVGDYHTLKQSQRAFLKLAQHAASRVRPVVLGLEFVQGNRQRALDAYLRGELSDADFLRGIRYAEHQVFDVWPNFKPILELARAQGIPCIALDHAGLTLRQRDEHAATRIAQALRRPGSPQVLVLAGQLHVAPPHLPARVAERVDARALVLYQNCEELYWRLADRGLEQRVEAVRVREGEYCLVNTSPIVCQRSFLDWLESDFDGLTVEPSAPDARFKEMARMIAAFLGLDAEEALDEVEVYAAGDLSFLQALQRRGAFSPRELALIKRQVLSRESYYVPRAHLVYLANLSVNHAAEEATRVVRHFCVGDALLETRSLVDSFYARCIEDALAFFGSKIVNDRRKAAHERVWRARLTGPNAALRRVAEGVLAHREFERGHRARVTRLYHEPSPELFHATTRALGHMLGDRLYYALIAGEVRKREIRELFLDPLDEEGAAMALYLHLSKRLRRVAVPRTH